RYFPSRAGVTLLVMFCLASCGEQPDQTKRAEKNSPSQQAQESRCAELEKLFAMDNWDSLTTGQFETNDTEHTTITQASAKIAIAGAESCDVSRASIKSGSIFSDSGLGELQNYSCHMPVPKSAGNDALLEVNAFAAPWKSCVNGWKEFSPPPV